MALLLDSILGGLLALALPLPLAAGSTPGGGFLVPLAHPSPQGTEGALRSRAVGLDLGTLEATLVSRGSLTFDLFDDATFEGRVDECRLAWRGALTLSGPLFEGAAPAGSFLITVLGDCASADLSTDRGSYRISPMPDGLHRVEELDPRRETCAADDGLLPFQAPGTTTGGGVTIQSVTAPWLVDGGLDVAMYYTPAVLAQLGSVDAVECFSAHCAEWANKAFANSAVTGSFRIVRVAQVNYAFDQMGVLLARDRLAASGDGYMDEVHAERDAYQADLVGLIIGSQGGGVCGAALRPDSFAEDNSDMAFMCIGIDCNAKGFTHEFGHTLGLCHDRQSGNCNGITDYGYGYHLEYPPASGTHHQTVMAYGTDNLIQHWSNPAVLYPDALGVPTGIADPDPNSADAAATMLLTIPMVDAYRIGGPVPGLTALVSRAGQGGPTNGDSTAPALDRSGRWVAFDSAAPDVVSSDSNGARDVFVADRTTGVIARVSILSTGQESNGDSYSPAISGDGRYVAFLSDATNLAQPDTNGTTDVFVHDRDFDGNGLFDEPLQTRTLRVSLAPGGLEANGRSRDVDISADGRQVAFASLATNLAPGVDGNGFEDVFVYDRDSDGNGVFDEQGGTATVVVSVSVNGQTGEAPSRWPSLSATGRFVAFQSQARDLVNPTLTGTLWDIFRRDRDTLGDGTFDQADVGTTYISAKYLNNVPHDQGDGNSTRPDLAQDDPTHIAFRSLATNLGAGTDSFLDIHLAAGTAIAAITSGQNGDSSDPSISPDGTRIAFTSSSDRLVIGDTNQVDDVFLYACVTGRVSIGRAGAQVDGASAVPDLSTSENLVAFASDATDLVLDDGNLATDVFVRDLATTEVATATLLNFKVQAGTASGVLGDLEFDDGATLDLDAVFQGTLPPWSSVIDVRTSLDGYGSPTFVDPVYLVINLRALTHTNLPWAVDISEAVSLKSFSTGAFDVQDTADVTKNADRQRQIVVANPSDYIDPATGRVTVRIQASAMGAASDPGFVTHFDLVEVVGY